MRVAGGAHPVERDPVRRDVGADGPGGLGGVMRPQVVEEVAGPWRHPQRGGAGGDDLGRGGVEQPDDHIAVRLGFREDLPGGGAGDPGCVDGILIDRDHIGVLQQAQVGGVEAGQVGAEN